MISKKNKATHDPLKFEEYIPYSGAEGEGFILAQNTEYEEVYIFDDYGSWVDTELNYYDKNAIPVGWFDEEFNFYDMKGQRIQGGYKGGEQVERRINEIKRYIKKVQDNERAKFLIEFDKLPVNTKPDQILQYVYDRCNIVPEMIDECKKNNKDASKAFIVVRGSMLVYKIITLEGRRFRIKEKDGTYSYSTIELFVKLSKFNNPTDKQNNTIIMAPYVEDDINEISNYKILFEGYDQNQSDDQFKQWLNSYADLRNNQIFISRQKNSGIIELNDEDLKFRILKLNGKKFGESTIFLKNLK